MQNGQFKDIFFDPDTGRVFSDDFLLNISTELIGVLVGAFVIATSIEYYRRGRENKKWKSARARFAKEVAYNHSRGTRRLKRLVTEPQEDVYVGGGPDEYYENVYAEVEENIEFSRLLFMQWGFALTPDIVNVYGQYLDHLEQIDEAAKARYIQLTEPDKLIYKNTVGRFNAKQISETDLLVTRICKLCDVDRADSATRYAYPEDDAKNLNLFSQFMDELLEGLRQSELSED